MLYRLPHQSLLAYAFFALPFALKAIVFDPLAIFSTQPFHLPFVFSTYPSRLASISSTYPFLLTFFSFAPPFLIPFSSFVRPSHLQVSSFKPLCLQTLICYYLVLAIVMNSVDRFCLEARLFVPLVLLRVVILISPFHLTFCSLAHQVMLTFHLSIDLLLLSRLSNHVSEYHFQPIIH